VSKPIEVLGRVTLSAAGFDYELEGTGRVLVLRVPTLRAARHLWRSMRPVLSLRRLRALDEPLRAAGLRLEVAVRGITLYGFGTEP
jgi:hypothetical protein